MMLTEEDVDFLLNLVKHTDWCDEAEEEQIKRIEVELAELKKLWSKEGLPVKEVDIYLLGEVPGRKQLTQIHSFAVGDTYKLLPEDEAPVSTYYNYNLSEAGEVDDWKIQDIRTHMVKE